MGYKNYDPSLITVSFKGIPIGGFAKGTFVKIERNTDTFTLEKGSQGDGTRVRSRDRSGKITFTLMAESPSNDFLSRNMLIGELTGLDAGPSLVKNINGTSMYGGPDSWIVKPPDSEYADTASNREWVLEVNDLEIFVGGAVL